MEKSEIDACYFRARELAKRVQEFHRIREAQSKQQTRFNRNHKPFPPPEAVAAVLHDEALDTLTSRFLIAELGKVGNTEAAIALLTWVCSRSSAAASSKPLFDAALAVCASQMSVGPALDLLQRMIDDPALAPDIVSFNHAIVACIAGGHVKVVEEILDHMDAAGVRPNTFTAAMVLQTCKFKRKRGHHHLALRVYRMLMNSLGQWEAPPEEVTDALFSVCEASIDGAESVPEAEDVFSALADIGLAYNTRTYNALLRACARQRDWQAAMLHFDEMGSLNIMVDTLSFNSIIKACLGAGAIEKALQVFEWVVDGHGIHDALLADADTYDTLVRTCHQAGMLEKALEVITWAHSTGIRLDSGTYEEVCATVEVAALWDTKTFKGLGKDKTAVLFPHQLRPAPVNDARLLYLSHVDEHEEEELLAQHKLGTHSWVPSALRNLGNLMPPSPPPKNVGPRSHVCLSPAPTTLEFSLDRVLQEQSWKAGGMSRGGSALAPMPQAGLDQERAGWVSPPPAGRDMKTRQRSVLYQSLRVETSNSGSSAVPSALNSLSPGAPTSTLLTSRLAGPLSVTAPVSGTRLGALHGSSTSLPTPSASGVLPRVTPPPNGMTGVGPVPVRS